MLDNKFYGISSWMCCFYLKSLGFSDRQSSYLQFSLKGSRTVWSFVKAVTEYSLGVDYPHYRSRAHLGFLLNVCKPTTRALSSGWWKKQMISIPAGVLGSIQLTFPSDSIFQILGAFIWWTHFPIFSKIYRNPSSDLWSSFPV